MVNNYFAVGKQVFPFDDEDRSEATEAYTQARCLETEERKVRLFRASSPHLLALCDRVVGVSR